MLTRIALIIALLASLPVYAADPAPAAKPAAAKPAASTAGKPATAPANTKAATAPAKAAEPAGKAADSLSTNVVGSQEAPTVLNVVPWKDKEVKLEKKNPTTNILNNVLQPLDRDVLRREVQYFRSLQESTQ